MSNWWIDSKVNGGYPHIPNIGNYNLTLPYRSSNGWVLDNGIIAGYPHRFYNELTPPVYSPMVLRVKLDSNFQFAGLIHDLRIEMSLRHVQIGDTVDVFIKNTDDQEVYSTSLTADKSGNFSLLHVIDASKLEAMPVGSYAIETIVRRPGESEASMIATPFAIHEAPRIKITNANPVDIHKPITSENNSVKFDYEIESSEVVERYDFQASINGEPILLSSMRELEIPATTVSGAMSTSTLTLNVTTPILLVSVAHFVRGSTVSASNTFTLTYIIDGVTYPPLGPFPGGTTSNPDAFREFLLPKPVVLNTGTRTITVSSNTTAIRYFQTTARPQVPEFSIAGTGNIHRMKMNYSIVGAASGTAEITLDGDTVPGEYELIANGDAQLSGKVVPINGKSTEGVKVHRALIELGEITQSVSQAANATRYVGVGADNIISAKNITGVTGAQKGDTVNVRLFWGSATIYSHSETLTEDITEYSHTIPASIFAGMTIAREHFIDVSIHRGAFVDTRRLAYTTIARPVPINSNSTMHTLFDLPLSSPRTLTRTLTISNGIGCDVEVKGSIFNILEPTDELISDTMKFDSISASPGIMAFSFADISGLQGGLYDLAYTFEVSHKAHGSFVATISQTSAFTVAYPGVPGISRLSLDFPGRYVGAHRDIAVTSRLFNIVNAVNGGDQRDQLRYELREGSRVIHSFTTGNLVNLANVNHHTIPAINFSGMRPGTYTIAVTSMRGGQDRQTETVQYEAVQPPTLHFVGIDPDELHLPIDPPANIDVELFVNGRGIDRIHGALGLEGTNHAVQIDVSTQKGGS